MLKAYNLVLYNFGVSVEDASYHLHLVALTTIEGNREKKRKNFGISGPIISNLI